MKLGVFILLLFALSYVILALADTDATQATTDDAEAEEEFKKFKIRQKKTYRPDQEKKRKMQFKKNHALIKKHNREAAAGKHTYTIGHNRFSDLTPEEFEKMTGYIPEKESYNASSTQEVSDTYNAGIWPDLPASIDWRKLGAVTSVKDQGQCGVCWIFAATGALEGQYFRATGKLVDFSEQQMLDCIRGSCAGGTSWFSYEYVRQKGIQPRTTYSDPPYTASFGGCRYNESLVETMGYGNVIVPRSGDAVKAAVATIGPLSVSFYAGFEVKFFQNGIYNPDCSHSPNHAAVIVGYDTDANGQDYWIMKNSWSSDWGNDGYFKMVRNSNTLCAIGDIRYPIIRKSPGCYVDHTFFPNTECIFPFTYKGKTYNECAFSLADRVPFCAVKLEDDGSFIYSDKTRGVCSPSCPGGSAKISDFVVSAGAELLPGEIWASVPSDSCSYLTMQTDGNLVLLRKSDKRALWASGTWNTWNKGAKAVFQSDGNLVVLDATGKEVWTSNMTMTDAGGAMLMVQDDGNMVIYDADFYAIWSSRTYNYC